MSISKELLSEVLDDNLDEVADINQAEVFIKYTPTDVVVMVSNARMYGIQCPRTEKYLNINIHELAFKVKEWADKNHYWIDSNTGFVSIGIRGNGETVKTFNGYDLKLDEPSLIFLAGQWILENRHEKA